VYISKSYILIQYNKGEEATTAWLRSNMSNNSNPESATAIYFSNIHMKHEDGMFDLLWFRNYTNPCPSHMVINKEKLLSNKLTMESTRKQGELLLMS
jgi:hypothetical protein